MKTINENNKEIEFFQVVVGNRRYICTEPKITKTSTFVRIPLHVWNNPTEQNILEYMREMNKKLKRKGQ